MGASRRHPALAAVLGLALVGIASLACAKVAWTNWEETSFQAEVDRAAQGHQLVALVVTQPDWCPPCIKLNRRWLENPAESELSRLAGGMLWLEVPGYDPPGAALLKQQGVLFHGTPTLHVFRPETAGQSLGRARLLGSVVGAPDDFPSRVKAIVEGHDPIAEITTRLAGTGDGVRRREMLLELADAHVARGDADAAIEAIRKVRAPRLSPDGRFQRPELAERRLGDLARRAEWMQAATVDLRLRKDDAKALAEIDGYVAAHGAPPDEAEDIAYARAWALARLGRTAEALETLEATFVRRGSGEGLSTFAYACFRLGTPELLAAGEKQVRDALGKLPEREAALQEALGRILRRQGRLAEAERAFEAAVRAARDEESRLTYEGELAYLRREMRPAPPPHP